MTQVFIFNEEGRVQVRDEAEKPERIVAAINQGRWEDYIGYEPKPTQAWQALQLGSLVLVINPLPPPKCDQLKLIPQDYQVLQALCSGLTMAQAAHQLHVDTRTIRNRVARLRRTFKSRTNLELIAQVVALGIVTPNLDKLLD